MAILQNDKLKYYHPCNTMIDSSGITWVHNALTWDAETQFIPGKIGSGIEYSGGGSFASISDNASGGYGHLGGASRVTTAFWGSGLSYPGTAYGVMIGFSSYGNSDLQCLQIWGDDEYLRMWNGNSENDGIQNALTIPTSGWHFYVIDAEWTGSDWTIRHSLDGSGWVSDGTISISAMVGTPTKTVIFVAETTTKVDDVALWKDATLFTSQELQNLYNLGNQHGIGLDQYEQTYGDSITSSKNLFIQGYDDITVSGNLFTQGSFLPKASSNLYICGPVLSTTSNDLFTLGPLQTTASGNLFIYGWDNIEISEDLFIHGHDNVGISGNLFTDGYGLLSGPCNLFIYGSDSLYLYMDGLGHVSSSSDMLTYGPLLSTASGNLFIKCRVQLPAQPIDWLLKSSDHYPQIIGTLESATSVTIQLWEVTDGQNTPVSLVSSDCYQIGNTGRWAWSTVNLPTYITYQRQYFYIMIANNGVTFEGQFFLEVPERAKWIHPSSRDDYLL